MKVVILAGGYGSRIAEYTNKIPKPMIKVGKKPIIEHLINFYSKFGCKDFFYSWIHINIILLKSFFKNKDTKNLNIKVVNTGLKSLTGKRIFKLKKKFLKMRKIFFDIW